MEEDAAINYSSAFPQMDGMWTTGLAWQWLDRLAGKCCNKMIYSSSSAQDRVFTYSFRQRKLISQDLRRLPLRGRGLNRLLFLLGEMID